MLPCSFEQGFFVPPPVNCSVVTPVATGVINWDLMLRGGIF